MSIKEKRLVRRVTFYILIYYVWTVLFGLSVLLAMNVYFQVKIEDDWILQCIWGPAVTIAGGALEFLLFYLLCLAVRAALKKRKKK